MNSRFLFRGIVALTLLYNPFVFAGTLAYRQADAAAATTNLVAPEAPSRWDHTPQDIANEVKAIQDLSKQTLDKIASLGPQDCTFESVFLELARLEGAKASLQPLAFYARVSQVKEIRDAAITVTSALGTLSVEYKGRAEIFDAEVNAQNNIMSSGQWDQLGPEEQLLVEQMTSEGKLDGLGLPNEQQVDLKQIRKDLNQAVSEFVQNVNTDKQTIPLSAEELKGLPEDILSKLTKQQTGDDRQIYDVPLAPSSVTNVYTYAEDPNVRQTVYEKTELRLPANINLLERILDLRRKQTDIIGRMDYKAATNVITDADTAKKFLDDLQAKLEPYGLKDKDALLATKQKDLEGKGGSSDGEIKLWDYGYYNRKFVEEKFSFNEAALKEYFPLSVILPKIFGVFLDLFGVRFEEVKDTPAWNPDVQTFAVWNKDATDESGFLGYCYFDLYARSDKTQAAGATTFLAGYEKADGTRAYPSIGNFASFPPSTEGKPSLLLHSQVILLFQMLSISFSQLLSKTRFSRYHGILGMPFDFVQAPVIMFENFAWEPKVLAQVSSHYERPEEALPPDLIQSLVNSRSALKGLEYLRLLYPAQFDLAIHTDQQNRDYTALWNTLRRDTMKFTSQKDTPGQTLQVVAMENYDAQMYSFLLGNTYAADIYDTVFKGDPLDPARGLQYREKFLSVGSSRKTSDTLMDLLGHLPNNDAFFKRLDECQTQ